MRRQAALPVALTVLALVAGCSGGDAANGAVWETPGVSATPLTTPSGPVLSADARETCDKATRISTRFSGTFMADLKQRIDAAGKGSSARSRAQAAMNRHVNEYSSALATLAGNTREAALKKTLKQMSSQVKVLKGDISKLNPTKMSAITVSLDKACGRS